MHWILCDLSYYQETTAIILVSQLNSIAQLQCFSKNIMNPKAKLNCIYLHKTSSWLLREKKSLQLRMLHIWCDIAIFRYFYYYTYSKIMATKAFRQTYLKHTLSTTRTKLNINFVLLYVSRLSLLAEKVGKSFQKCYQ